MQREIPCTMGERLDFGHLGGTSTTGDPDSWYPELWLWLTSKFNIERMLDVGCGVGFTQKFFEKQGIVACGIDCEQVLERHLTKTNTISHDLMTGPAMLANSCDLVWCCEVAEHVEQGSVDNVIQTIVGNAKTVVAFCAAPEGAGGYHHVNCQNPHYWINKFTDAGLEFSQPLTDEACNLCDASHGRGDLNYFRRSGLIFVVKAELVKDNG